MNEKSIYQSIKFVHFFYVSNLISVLRMLLAIPIYFALKAHNLKIVFALIIIGVFTDFLDGFYARKRNEVSELGKVLDPMADKIIVIFTALALVESYGLPKWLGLSIIIRDILIVLGSIFLSTKIKMVNPSNIIGKITVNVIAFTLISYMFDFVFFIPMLNWLSLIFILLSILSYIIDGLTKIKKA